MKKRLFTFLAYLGLLIFKLRYRISYKNFKKLKKESLKRKGGILFLPNHPAEIDPVILVCALWKQYQPRPLVVENFFFMKGISFFMRLVKAIPIPNFEISANSWKIKKGEIARKRMTDGLKRGENFLVYPTGHLKRSGKDVVGGSSLVHKILEEYPEVNIVLVRTEGLWGSSFSRALTGKVPDFWSVLFKGAKILLKNGIFFAPKRKVSITFLPFPQDFPYEGSRAEINEYIENWMNNYSGKEKEEPLKLVSYAFYKKELPKAEAAEKKKAPRKKIQIPQEKKDAVFHKLAEISGRKVKEIDEQMDLATDLNLDSLDIASLHAYLDQSFNVGQISLTELKTVHDVLEAAMGLKEAEKEEEEDFREWKYWPEEKNRPNVFMPKGHTLQEAFLSAVDQMNGFTACADANTGFLTYKQLKRAALILAERFKHFPGKYIGVLLPSSVGVYLIVFGLLLAKKIPVMLNWTAGVRSLNFAALLLDLEIVISARRFLDHVQAIELGTLDDHLVLLEDVRSSLTWKEKIRGIYLACKKKTSLMKKLDLQSISPKDPTLLLFTSGTETFPKAVPLSHENLLSNERASLSCVDIAWDDILYGVLPPFHSFGFSITGIMPLLSGLRAFYFPDPNDSYMMAKEIEHFKPTMLCMAPSFYKNLFKVADPAQLKSVRLFVTGAERAPKELFEYVKNLDQDAVMLEGYGITECSPVVTICRQNKPQIGVGEPLPGVELCIVHPETDKLLPKGEMGEICIKGPNVFQGYLGKEVRNPFINLNGEMWYRSGDMGFLDEDGNLILGGRLKRFIKVGGEMVSLTAVEEELVHKAREKDWTSFEDDKPKLALTGFEKYEGKPYLVLFSTFPLSRDEANTALRDSGFGKIVKISEVKKIQEIPLTGTGKIHYRVLEEKLLDED
ncbi:MAG: hypothetical protein Tsb0015_00600 [Simkaniaceae bacterium]